MKINKSSFPLWERARVRGLSEADALDLGVDLL
jgi:hypothetical protein